MNENAPQKATSSDEIDLLELLAKAIQVIRKNLIIIIVAVFLGGIIGVVYYNMSPNVYESKMLISSDILSEAKSKSVIDNISKLIKERNITSLSKKLNLTPEQVSKLAAIEIKSVEENPEGSQNSRTNFLIEAKSIDNTIWPALQTAIVSHLENNDFVKIRVEQKIKYTKQMIEKIDSELLDLEKLKEGGTAQNNKQNLVLFDPTTINSKILDLNKEKINLQNNLEVINSVQVVEGFTIFTKPVAPKLSYSIISGITFGLICVSIFIGFKAIRLILRFSHERVRNS